MIENPDHNKIIKKTARAVLSTMGLIQKGQSRTWIDDNGWYFTVVEFQPSAYGKGSYLNIGIHFLWSKHDYLSYDIGGREDGFAEFDGDESKFYSDMLSFAEKCSVLVQQYRLFKKESHAKEYILKNKITYSSSWDLYHKMMICGLTKDHEAVFYFQSLVDKTAFSTVPYEMEIYRELTQNMMKIIKDTDRLYEYVCTKIEQTRIFWRSKFSMRKLKE